MYMKMTRKFSKSTDVWTKYGIFHYKNGNSELARKLLVKSFNSLDKVDRKCSINYITIWQDLIIKGPKKRSFEIGEELL